MRVPFISLFALASVASCHLVHPPTSSSAHALIDEALTVLGGKHTISKINGVTLHSPNIYRSRSLMQSYNLYKADTAIAVSGSQNISFGYASEALMQRIDRIFKPSEYWAWESPRLDDFDQSLVVRGGTDGFACYIRGNSQIWLPANVTSGYTDAALAEFLVSTGNIFSPKVLLDVQNHHGIKATKAPVNGIEMPAVYDPIFELTIIFDPSTHRPYIVRSEEQHMIYGPSTNDLYLSQFKTFHGVQFPCLYQSIYNSSTQNFDAILEEFVVENVTINPTFPKNYFQGLPDDEGFFPIKAPKKTEGLSHAHILEFSSNTLWSGSGSGFSNETLDNIGHRKPVPGLPNVHWLIVDDEQLGVKQFVIEFEDHVVVGDAPPQWTRQVIEWIEKNIGKPIKYLWPTHHHRDHSGGAAEYVKLGAKLIVPEVAAKYWSSIPNAELITFNDTHPYVHSDSKHEAWFIWEQQTTHSIDWSYTLITDKCPTDKSDIALIEADVWHPGMPDENNGRWEMREWLGQLQKDGVPEHAYVLPTHGQIGRVEELIEHTTYVYAPRVISDWRRGGAMCKE